MMTESVTVTVQNGAEAGRGTAGQAPAIRLNVEYFRTLPGLCKLAQMILGIICIALGSPGYWWFVLVAVTAFIVSVIWSAIYLFSVREALKIPINWLLTELCNMAIYTILYFTAFIVELALLGSAKYILAGIFGIFNTFAYAASTYFLYLEYQSSQ